MFSESFMRYLMDYQKNEFTPQKKEERKEIPFKNKGGKVVKVTIEIGK